jgi:predicted ATPase
MDSDPKTAGKRSRGLILTEEALVRLDQELRKQWDKSVEKQKSTTGKLKREDKGLLLGIETKTADKIYRHEPVGEGTLRHVFDTLSITPRFSKERYCVSVSPPSGNLPHVSTSCIGRETQATEIKALLEANTLVTLIGTGGVGKTRLAIQVAQDVKSLFAAGIWFVELAGTTDQALVPQRVATTLGVQEEKERPLIQTLADFLRGKPLLLILDNCEHLLEACATLADPLLSSSSRLRILATSRERLNISAECPYRVPSLAVPDPKRRSRETEDSAKLLLDCASVRLFVQRATVHRPGFTVTSQNASLLVSICHRLDGIPLAIELAAARIRAMSIEDLDRKLNDCFRILTGGSTAALPRHQTLRATMDWSYDLLNEKEKALLRRLAVFVDGCGGEGAEQVCAGDGVEEQEVLDLLTSLVDKSLVVYQEREGQARYRLLETMRQYAAGRLLERGERDVLRGRHRDYFLALAKEHCDVNRGENRTVLDLEWPNIVGAAQIAADGLDWEHTSQLTSALGPFLMMRGEWSVREQMNKRVLDVLHHFSDPATEARRIVVEAVALNALGVVARVRTQWGEAESWFLASIKAWDRCHNGGDKWKTLINLGILYRSQHRLDEAETIFSNAIADSQGAIDTGAQGCAHVNLGVVLQMQGRYTEAKHHFDAGLKRISSMGHRLGEAQIVNNRGILNRTRWSLKEAESDFVTSLALRGLNGGESGIAQTKSNLAIVLQMLGRLEESEEVTVAALDVRRVKGNREGTAASLINLALLREMQGRRNLAESSLNEALEICLALKDQVGEAKVRNNLGVIGQEHACLQAVNDFDQSLALCRKINDIEGIGRALLNLANTARRAGNLTAAEQLESEAFAIYPMMKEQQANFTAEWERDPAIAERFRTIPYFTNQAARDDLADVVARTLVRFRWWDSPAALDAE